MNSIILNEYRCECGKLLCKGVLLASVLELKCRFCHKINSFNGIEWMNLKGSDQYAILAAISTADAQQEDPSPYIIDATESTFSILGFTREELIGREVRSLDPLMASKAYGNLWKLIVARNFQPFILEVYQPMKNGMYIKVRGKTVFQLAKDIIFLFTIFDPIDILPGTHDQLSPSTDMNIKNMFCSFIAELDKNGICDTVTYEFANLLGYIIADIINKNFFDLYPKDIMEERKKMIIKMAASRQSFRIRNDVIEDKNGVSHIFDSYFTARYSDLGVFAGFSVALWPV